MNSKVFELRINREGGRIGDIGGRIKSATSRRCFVRARQQLHFHLLACIFLSVQFIRCTAGGVHEPSITEAFGQ